MTSTLSIHVASYDFSRMADFWPIVWAQMLETTPRGEGSCKINANGSHLFCTRSISWDYYQLLTSAPGNKLVLPRYRKKRVFRTESRQACDIGSQVSYCYRCEMCSRCHKRNLVRSQGKGRNLRQMRCTTSAFHRMIDGFDHAIQLSQSDHLQAKLSPLSCRITTVRNNRAPTTTVSIPC